MAAYMIAEVDVTDPKGFEEYRKLVPETIAKYKGKFLVRGGATETVEGNWSPKRLVILEFESMKQAKEWYYSREYTAAKEIRFRAANTNLVLVEGV